MKIYKTIILLPLVVITSSCVATDFNPFQEDEYVPIGFETDSIIRALNDEETLILEDSFERIDSYVTGQNLIGEQRQYDSSYFGDYAPDGANEVDYAFSITSSQKTYNNNVKTEVNVQKESLLSDYVDITNVLSLSSWTFLPTVATYEVRRSTSLNGADAEVATFASGAYVEASDYQSFFGYETGTLSEAIYINVENIGMNADDKIIAIDRTSAPIEIELSRNGYARGVVNFISETEFVLYEPEDSDDPIYLPVQYREYTETTAISEIYHDGQVIKYLDQPIIVGYSEIIYSWSTEDNGDYTIADIPELTEV